MKIKGTHSLSTDVKTLWAMLQNAEVLARISPGVSRIEKTGPDQYKAVSEINIGPVRGSFEGDLELKDKKEDEAMTLVLSQKSAIGNAEATITMNFQPDGIERTNVSYEGNAKVSGRLATMGQRILGGVISNLSKQVFKELESVITEKKDALKAPTTKVDPNNPEYRDKNQKKSFFQSIIDKILSIWR